MSIVSRKVIHCGGVGEFGIDQVVLPSGRTATLDVLRHPGAAAAVVFRDASRIVMLRQYRHAAGVWLWEIPAGKLDEGEAPRACIEREIEEETGLRAGTLVELGQIVVAPGYSDERLWLYEARDLQAGTMQHGAGEEIEVHEIELEEALSMIDRGDIIDAKTICALHLVARRHRRR